MDSNKRDAAQAVQKLTGIKTYDMVQFVTGPLDGELDDWPANIQDAILEAFEKKAQEVEHPLAIIHSRCDIDHGAANDGSEDRFYIHVIASEIVVGDAKFDEERENLRSLISDIMSGRRTH